MDKIFTTYGLTGNTAVDAIILSTLIPFLVGYANMVFLFIKQYLIGFIASKFMALYTKIKKQTLGEVDMCLCISDDKNIYATIKNIIFSPDIKSDVINAKTLGMLELLTDGKNEKFNYVNENNNYDMYMDAYNDIVVQKKANFRGSAISKKYFQFDTYYIVVSENKKADYGHMFDMEHENEKVDKIITHFIMFEAIRIDKSPKDDTIITKFLNTKFNLKLRIPYKYHVKIINNKIINRLSTREDYVDGNSSLAQLSNSDPTSVFLDNPKIKEFYANQSNIANTTEKINVAPSSIVLDHIGNSLNLNNLKNDLTYIDMTANDNKNVFEPRFKSLLLYFFGNEYKLDNVHHYFFSFKDNKIILYFRQNIDNKYVNNVLIVSFQEALTHEDISGLIEHILTVPTPKKTDDESRKLVTYGLTQNQWNVKKCDSKTYDTLYLPKKTLELITCEMDKFMCFEKIYAKINVAYKKGFLFYGPPGTGKTSTVKALAHKYNIPIFIIDISNSSINDESIITALNSISGTGVRIVLFEDIDSAFSEKEKLITQVRENVNTEKENTIEKEQKCLTYSGLLNALDGVQTSQHGTIVIMTTNYVEKLGKALIRPGRIDFAIELTYCDHYQLVTMTTNILASSYKIISDVTKDDELSKYIFHNPYTTSELDNKINKFADLLMEGKDISTVEPCKLQVYILKYLDNVDNIFNNYQELLTPTM